jgi:hypothetical protein
MGTAFIFGWRSRKHRVKCAWRGTTGMKEGKGGNMNEGETLFSLIGAMLDGLKNPPQPMFRTQCDNGLSVSTVNTSDMGMETAIIAHCHAHPVERYKDSAKAAKAGHKKWVEFCNQENVIGKKITELGCGCVESREITL